MKWFWVILAWISVTGLRAQDSGPGKMEGDTLITSSGFRIAVGQELTVGTGTTPDGDFRFIRRNSTGFGTMMMSTGNNAYDKSQLSLTRSMAGHKGKVTKIVKRGNNRTGIVYQPLISFGMGQYEIDIENAIAAGELVVPEPFRKRPGGEGAGGSATGLSVADELLKLKKLMDQGILTQAEYEAQKKKLLEKH